MIATRVNTATLELRRREVGISCPALARRSGVSLSTVNRILSGAFHDVKFGSLCAVAEALGMTMSYADRQCQFAPKATSFDYRVSQARQKAERLVKLTQGTSALEGQAVGPTSIREAVEQTVAMLLAGPRRRLWA